MNPIQKKAINPKDGKKEKDSEGKKKHQDAAGEKPESSRASDRTFDYARIITVRPAGPLDLTLVSSCPVPPISMYLTGDV